MGVGKDINGRHAQSWKDANVSKIMSISASRSKKDLLESIKKIVSLQAKVIQGDKGDTKYRSIIDLVMLRVNSVLEEFDYNTSVEIDSKTITSLFEEYLQTALESTYGNEQHLTIKEFADAVSTAIKSTSSKIVNNPQQKSTAPTIDSYALEDVEVEEESTSSEEESQQDNTKSQEDGNSEEQDSIEKGELDKKKALQSIQLNIDAQFTRLFNLCSATSKMRLPNQVIEKDIQQQQKQKQLPIKKQIEEQQKLEKKQIVSSIAIEGKKKEKGKNEKQQKVPSEIAQDNIYKFNKKMFQGLRVSSIALTLGIIGSVQKYTSTVGKAFMALPLGLIASFEYAMDMSKKIYKAIHKSLLQRIFEYFKGKLVKRLLTPIKDRIIGAIKKMIPNWLKSFGDIINKFFQKVKSTVKLVFKGIMRAFKWIWRTFKKVFGWFKKAFGKIVSMIKNAIKGIFKALTNIFKWAAKALRAIYRFAKNGIKAISKLFKKGGIKKLFKALGSKIKGAFNKLKNGVKSLKNGVKNALSKGNNFFKNALSRVKNAMKNAAKKIGKAIKNVIAKVVKKVFTVVKNTTKKIVQKIMKKLGINIAKKIAKKKAKSLLMVGAKKILGFFKKWVLKFIAKLAAKILGAAAVNAIPILGQIISVCMMIYTIVDTIVMFWDVYNFMKENPEAWTFMKEKVAEWATKAFSFMKDLLAFGKKLFRKIFIDGPKKLAKGIAHMLNFVANPFSRAKRAIQESQYIKQLEEIKKERFKLFNSLDNDAKKKLFDESFKKSMQTLESIRLKADSLTKDIKEEQDSWWPNNSKVMKLMANRQELFKKMMELASTFGLEDFSSKTCAKATAIFDNYQKKEAERKRLAEELAKHRKEMALKYANKRIDIEALQKICKDQQDKQNAFNADIEAFTQETSDRANALMDQLQLQLDGETDDEEDSLDVAIV